jgi:hypothetical protein
MSVDNPREEYNAFLRELSQRERVQKQKEKGSTSWWSGVRSLFSRGCEDDEDAKREEEQETIHPDFLLRSLETHFLFLKRISKHSRVSKMSAERVERLQRTFQERLADAECGGGEEVTPSKLKLNYILEHGCTEEAPERDVDLCFETLEAGALRLKSPATEDMTTPSPSPLKAKRREEEKETDLAARRSTRTPSSNSKLCWGAMPIVIIDDYLSALVKKDIDEVGSADDAQILAAPVVCLSPCSLQVDNPVVLHNVVGKSKATTTTVETEHSPQPNLSDCSFARSTTFANWGLEGGGEGTSVMTHVTPPLYSSALIKRLITSSGSDSPSSSSSLSGDWSGLQHSPAAAPSSSGEASNSSATSFATVFTSPQSVNSRYLSRIEYGEREVASSCESVHAKRIDFSDVGLVRLAEPLSSDCNSKVQVQQPPQPQFSLPTKGDGKAETTSPPRSVVTKPSPDCVLDDSWLSPGTTVSTVEKKKITSLVGNSKVGLFSEISHDDDSSAEISEVEKLIITTAEKTSRDFYQSYLEHFHHHLPGLLGKSKGEDASLPETPHLKNGSSSSSNSKMKSCQEEVEVQLPTSDSPIPLSYPAKSSMSPLVRSLKIVRHSRKT